MVKVEEMAKEFLIELGVEELPPTRLRKLAEKFAESFKALLESAGVSHSGVKWFATPRRLALRVAEMAEYQRDKVVERRGPSLVIAFDKKGEPTQAAKGWAQSNAIDIEKADRLKTDKGEWLLYKERQKGQPVQSILVRLASDALSNLLKSSPSMRWGSQETQFIRPVRTLTILLGDELISGEVLGVKSSRIIRGHRFMGEVEFSIDTAEQYPSILEERGKVIADYDTRKAIIITEAKKAARRIEGKADLEDSLVEEVTSLVEWPVALTGKFAERFLAVPCEALVHTMKSTQRYFPIYDDDKKLLPNFIFISNIKSRQSRRIVEGNERVIHSRFSDAEFFFRADRKSPLIARLPLLRNTIFQEGLLTLKEKTDRVTKLAVYIAELIGADTEKSKRAGILSKCDLMTNMVCEFTETQGVMGMHYARLDGEDSTVANAINEQYMPRCSGDGLPRSGVSSALAIAEKIDTIVGMFGVGKAPKKGADPFALRRASLGILRIIIEFGYEIDLASLIERTESLFGDRLTNINVGNDTLHFILGRLRSWYMDKGFRLDVIKAVLNRHPTKPVDVDRRIRAISDFLSLDEGRAAITLNKRMRNILEKFESEISERINPNLLLEEREITLVENLAVMTRELEGLWEANDYKNALKRLALLQEPVNLFLDNVKIMVEDESVRRNRLAIIKRVRNIFLEIADISLLRSKYE